MKTSEQIAAQVRAKFEDYYGDEPGSSPSFENMCREMSEDLREALEDAGFSARRVPGQYRGMSESYAPDTSEWEDEDVDAYEGDPRMAHWWVVCEGRILDICADQFHPDNPQEYRVVITDEGDRDYEPMHGDDPDLCP